MIAVSAQHTVSCTNTYILAPMHPLTAVHCMISPSLVDYCIILCNSTVTVRVVIHTIPLDNCNHVIPNFWKKMGFGFCPTTHGWCIYFLSYCVILFSQPQMLTVKKQVSILFSCLPWIFHHLCHLLSILYRNVHRSSWKKSFRFWITVCIWYIKKCNIMAKVFAT